MRVLALFSFSLLLAGCVGDPPKPDGGTPAPDAGCNLPAQQTGIACGQTRCNINMPAASSCCVFGSSVQCLNATTCTLDAGAVFLWGCDSPNDCNAGARPCCVQSPKVAASGCPTLLTPTLPRTACQDLCTGNDVRLCANDNDCVSPKKCKPATIAGGGDTKVVGACL